jgi:hypothetical protein
VRSNKQMDLTRSRYLRQPPRLILEFTGRAAAVAERPRRSFAGVRWTRIEEEVGVLPLVRFSLVNNLPWKSCSLRPAAKPRRHEVQCAAAAGRERATCSAAASTITLWAPRAGWGRPTRFGVHDLRRQQASLFGNPAGCSRNDGLYEAAPAAGASVVPETRCSCSCEVSQSIEAPAARAPAAT